MYLDHITLKNLKGFKNLSFSLARPDGSYAGWTVFTGDNGSGKSTLLKAIAIGLTGRDVARSLQPSFHRWVGEDAHSQEASIELRLKPQSGIDEFVGKGGTSYSPFLAVIHLKVAGSDAVLEEEASKKKATSAQRGPWSAQAKGWFSCGYGPFRRVFGASPEATRLMVGPTTERYVTMFQEAASLFEVDQWLRSLNHKKLEQKQPEAQLLDLILELLRDDLMPNQITIDRVDSDGLWLRDRSGLQLAWTEMSDGYRAALALLADILRHLVKAYGFDGLAERDAEGKLRIVRSGVVMIDEIDAHLHPEWQREIGFWLKAHFPNIQFLVTTHSPIICQAADPNGLFVLPEPGSSQEPHALSDAEYQRIIASRPDTILLTPAFGLQNTRSPRAVQARSEYARLKAKQNAHVALSPDESARMQQVQLFALNPED